MGIVLSLSLFLVTSGGIWELVAKISVKGGRMGLGGDREKGDVV